MFRHLFYGLLITFLITILLESVRPNFVANFLNIDWLFLAVIASGVMALTESVKNNKIKS